MTDRIYEPAGGDLAVPRFLCARIRGGERAALLVVAAAEGSSPGAAGFKMAVAADGAQRGTIGGGAVEHRMVWEARKALGDGQNPPRAVWRFEHRAVRNEPDRLPSGMICGGGQIVVLRVCDTGDLPALDAWARGDTGRLELDASGIRFEAGPANGGPYFESSGDAWRYEEPVGHLETVHIIGGGHVGQALARQLALLPLRIVVVDPRPGMAVLFRDLPTIDVVAADYADGAAAVPEGDDRYAVIMTPEHAADYQSLRAVVGKRLRYVAVLGSRGKAEAFRERLRADGVPEERIRRVRLPAGVAIGSRTPAEIAVSIAAEIIAVRRGAAHGT